MPVQQVRTMEEFQTLLEASKIDGKLLVVDFTASWCGPCRLIGPIFETMAEEGENDAVTFAKVDVDAVQDVASACGVQVMPTFQFYKNAAKDRRNERCQRGKSSQPCPRLRCPGVSVSRQSELKPFFDACLSGDVDRARELLKKHPGFVSEATPKEWHDHHIMRGGWQPVESSLNPGVMNKRGTMYLRASYPAYALHLAAGNGHATMVKFLVEEANANLEATDGDGDTALTWATWCGRRETMDHLLAAGSDATFVDSTTREQFESIQGDGDSLEYLRKKRRE